MRLASLLALCAVVGGCNVGRAFIASPADYAEYRRVRLAETLDERLAAAAYYLEHRPDGRYRERVKRYFDHAEPIYFRARRRSDAGLEAYLKALPRGPHAAEALSRLMERRSEKRRQEYEARRVHEVGLRLDVVNKARRDAGGLLGRWVQALVDPRSWSGPLSQAPERLLVPYRIALPRPDCEPRGTGHRCTKTITRLFEVQGEEGREEREMTVELELGLDAGWRLSSARMSGELLFLQSAEASRGRALDEEDEDDLSEAFEAFVTAVEKGLAAEGRGCKSAREDDAVTMACGELILRVESGEDADIVTVTRAVPRESP